MSTPAGCLAEETLEKERAHATMPFSKSQYQKCEVASDASGAGQGSGGTGGGDRDTTGCNGAPDKKSRSSTHSSRAEKTSAPHSVP